MKQKCILILTICLFLVANGYPAELGADFNFERIDYTIGLPSNSIRRIHQDREGYMWYASNSGVIRYDGSTFVQYRNSHTTPTLLTSNTINTIADDQHAVWIGTDRGFNRWDKITRQFTKIEHDYEVLKIVVDKENFLWLATNNGVVKYYHEQDSVVFYQPSSTPNSLPSLAVQDICIDSQGNVWIAQWKSGLCRYNPAEDNFIAYPPINAGNSALCLFEDKEQNLWIGTWGYGLYKTRPTHHPQEMVYIKYQADIPSEYIYAIHQDPKYGYLWVGHRKGLSLIDIAQNSCTNYTQDGMSDLDAIYMSQTGVVWLGHWDSGGVKRVDLNSNPLKQNHLLSIKKRLGKSSISTMWYDGKQYLWIAIQNSGVYILDTYTEQITPLSTIVKNRALSSNAHIEDITYVDTYKEVWMAVRNGGVMRVSLDKNGYPTALKQLDQMVLNHRKVHKIHQDQNNNIWLLTSNGLSVISASGRVIRQPYFLPTKTTEYICQCYAQDKDNNMWIGTQRHGIFKFSFENDELSITPYTHEEGKINNSHITSILVDSKDQVWATTLGGGLNRFSSELQRFDCISDSYNTPYDFFFNTFEDIDGNIWALNENALVKFDTMNETCDILASSDKLWENVFNASCPVVKIDATTFLLGGINGYNTLQTERKYTHTAVSATVVIEDIKVYNKSIYTPEYADQLDIENSRITLNNDENNISFEFISPNFSNPSKIHYAYRLRGYDTNWAYTNNNQHYANYINLPKGNYTFEVKVADNHLNIAEAPIASMHLHILPAIYDTWYAWFIYVILVVTLAYLAFRIVRQRLRLKNQINIARIQKQNAEETTQIKLRFFTNISHELLTPLTVLNCIVDEVQKTKTIEQEQTDIMQYNISHLIRLIRQILEFRKVESENIQLKVGRGDISEAIHTMCEKNFRPLATKKQLEFIVSDSPNPIIGWYDSDKLEKMLYNLISNALKYNEVGGYVKVSYLEMVKGTVPHLQISVTDSGIGIPQDKIDKIFKRFYDGDYRKQHEMGTGIGLSLTKSLVELHNGTISVDSTVGKGSCFVLTIPIDIHSYDTSVIEIESIDTIYPTQPIEATLSTPDNMTILLVDDNSDLLQVVSTMLCADYHVLTAAHGKEALEIISSNNIDMVVSDVMMPYMDGYELCSHLKTHLETSHIPVLLLTAKNMEEDRTIAYQMGADAYIAKPFKPTLLKARITSLFDNREKHTQTFQNSREIVIDDITYTNLDEELLQKALEKIRQNLDNSEFNFDLFADEMGVSRSTLSRKLKMITGLTPSEFVKNIRLKSACQLFDKGNTNISDVAYAVGFTDPKYFGKCFKKEFGDTPSDYIKKRQ